MRRRTLLLAAGLLAYYFGATVRVYLRSADELCSCREAGCRILVVADHPRASLRRPLTTTAFLVAPFCSN
ncbi:MAG TPA: hypothetical protein VGP08_06495 [Pyrinomonadaceae bacterium]|jgi:hypothetical protein|nr:hypothetical protein [Pyrinomonadaceae bacterium]